MEEKKQPNLMTRREMLGAAAAIGLSVGLSALPGCGGGGSSSLGSPTTTLTVPTPTPVPVVPPFVQPPVEKSAKGLLNVTRTVKMATNTVNGKAVTTRTYEGALVAPTMRVKPGDTLRFNLVNNLPPNPDQNVNYPDMNTPHHFNSTNNHVHGLHVSPQGNSDNVLVEVLPSTSFQYAYKIPITHPPGTYWYHPHKHGAVSMQMFGGMAGALIVEGGMDDLPEVQKMRDLVFLVNELNIDPATGQVPDYVAPPPNSPNSFPLANRTLLVNGQVTPTLTALPGEVVRLRIINGTVRTTLPFSIDGHELDIAAFDGVTLPRTRHTTVGVQVSPGGRVDVFFRAQAPGTYAINKLADTANTLPDPQVILANLVVTGTPVAMEIPTTLPTPESLPDISASELTGRRTLTFAVSPTGGPPGAPGNPNSFPNFTIDGVRFDANTVNQTINLNAVEEWTLVNTSGTGHPFHIHVNPFQVVAVNGVPLAQPEWRDTILIPKKSGTTNGTVTIRSRFQDFTGLYVLHCHILVHEDIGMMQLVNVI